MEDPVKNQKSLEDTIKTTETGLDSIEDALDYLEKDNLAPEEKSNYVTHIRSVMEKMREVIPAAREYSKNVYESAINNPVSEVESLRARDSYISELGDEDCHYIANIDIDDFKSFNDIYGHDAGDDVLKKIANIISHSMRRDDGRGFHLHGEEMQVIYKSEEEKGNSDEDIALKIAERIKKNVEDNGKFYFRRADEVDSEPVKVTVSIGVSKYDKNQDFKYSEKKADNALYKAKASGKNCVRFL